MNNGRRWKSVKAVDLLPVTGPVLGDTCLKLCRIIDRQNTERRIQDVTSHVTQCACTKWIPRAPAPGSIYGIVVIVLRWSQPERSEERRVGKECSARRAAKVCEQ